MTPEQLKLIVQALLEMGQAQDAILDVCMDMIDTEDGRIVSANHHMGLALKAVESLNDSL